MEVRREFQVFIEGLSLYCISGCLTSTAGGTSAAFSVVGFASQRQIDFAVDIEGVQAPIVSWEADAAGAELAIILPSDPGTTSPGPLHRAAVRVCGPPAFEACAFSQVR
jgi:hypothetical protein